MNDSIRAFIALPVAPQVIQRMVACQQQLAREAGEAVRWTPEDQIHLTLQFLGNISAADLESIQPRLSNIMRSLHLRAEGIGAFPSPRNPRVIWVGVKGEIDELRAVQAAVENATGRKEEREFRPHLTIGRVREGRRAELELSRFKDEQFGEWEAMELRLMESRLSPKGATHTVLATFRARA
jgi:RNA 2',3'-cyclic 3'-phosphodiesterase